MDPYDEADSADDDLLNLPSAELPRLLLCLDDLLLLSSFNGISFFFIGFDLDGSSLITTR